MSAPQNLTGNWSNDGPILAQWLQTLQNTANNQAAQILAQENTINQQTADLAALGSKVHTLGFWDSKPRILFDLEKNPTLQVDAIPLQSN